MAKKKSEINDVLTPFLFGEENQTQKQDDKPNVLELVAGLGKNIFSMDNLPIKTELTKDQINKTMLVMFWAKEFNNKAVQDVVSTFMTLQISKDRKSRKEYLDLISKAISGYGETVSEENKGIAKHLFGVD